MSKVIDLNYIKKEQEKFSNHLESVKGMNTQNNTLRVSEGQILALASELYEVVNETKIHKAYDNYVNREKLLEELSDCLSMIGNIANSLNMDLVVEIEVTQVKNIEKQFIGLNYDILRLNKVSKILFARRKVEELIVPQFINIVYSLGFSLEELKGAYFKKMKKNYQNPKFMES